jgi:DNA-binding MarR family transcriptional regulator
VDAVVSERQDPVEWSREQWLANAQPAADQFAAMLAIQRTHQTMTAALDQALRAYDLTRTDYLLMTTLLLSKDFTRPLGQLSKHLMVHPTTITLRLEPLEKRRLVRRRPHPTDRRTVLATLTPTGRGVLETVTKALAAIDYGLGGVDDTLSGKIVRTLREVRHHIDEEI